MVKLSRYVMAPMLCVGAAHWTLRVRFFDAERHELHSHAERGNDRITPEIEMMDTGERAEIELHYTLSRKLFQFGLAIDTLNLKELENVFDSHIVGEYNGVVGHINRDQFISSVELNLGDWSNCGAKQHNIMNIQLLAHTEESATTRSNFYAIHQGKNDYAGKLWRTWGEYLDTWTLKDGKWRISFRKYTTYFNDGPEEINTPAA